MGALPVMGVPQQETLPAVLRAQLASVPTLTERQVPWGASPWPRSSAPQQVTELSLDAAQLWRPPDAMVQWPTGPVAALSTSS